MHKAITDKEINLFSVSKIGQEVTGLNCCKKDLG